ncbi:MAG: DUF1801 domain-containing protein [Dysgonomonas sp.]
MENDKINPLVDKYLNEASKWQKELKLLRSIILDSQLTEELKWKQPCYLFQKANVLMLYSFKENCQ